MKKIFTLALLFVFGISSAWASHHHDTTMSSEMAPMTIVENAVATESLSTLVTAVTAADLVDTLNSDWPFTVFAPINSAFGALPAGTVESLLEAENKWMLTEILTYHVVSWELMAKDLSDGMVLETLSGDKLKVTISDGMVFINNAMVTMADVDSSNGVVHVIDTVLMAWKSAETLTKMAFETRMILDAQFEMRVDKVLAKYDTILENISKAQAIKLEKKLFAAIDRMIMKDTTGENLKNMLMLLKYEIQAAGSMDMLTARVNGGILDIAMSSDDHTTLVAAVKAAGLVDALSAEGPFTVFAPLNSAFAELPEWTVEDLLKEENKDDLVNILTYHVAAWAYFPSDITDGLSLEMLNGESVEFSISEDGKVMVNDAMITTVNLVWNNGVIHIIDGVLLP